MKLAITVLIAEGKWDLIPQLCERAYDFHSDNEKQRLLVALKHPRNENSLFDTGKMLNDERRDILNDIIKKPDSLTEEERRNYDPFVQFNKMTETEQLTLLINNVKEDGSEKPNTPGEIKRYFADKFGIPFERGNEFRLTKLLNDVILAELEPIHKAEATSVVRSGFIYGYRGMFKRALEVAEQNGDKTAVNNIIQMHLESPIFQSEKEYYLLKDWSTRLNNAGEDPSEFLKVMDEIAENQLNDDFKPTIPGEIVSPNLSRIGIVKSEVFNLLRENSQKYGNTNNEEAVAKAILKLQDIQPDIVDSVVDARDEAAVVSFGDESVRKSINKLNREVFNNKETLIALVRDVGPQALSLIAGQYGFTLAGNLLKNYTKLESTLKQLGFIDSSMPEAVQDAQALTKILSLLLPNLITTVTRMKDNEGVVAELAAIMEHRNISPSGDFLNDIIRLNMPSQDELNSVIASIKDGSSDATQKIVGMITPLVERILNKKEMI
jgi:hypothetical protein